MSAMMSQFGDPTTPRLKKEDIGLPTDFRHVEHHGAPLNDACSDVELPLVQHNGGERADTLASTAEVDGENNTTYEIKMEAAPVPPPLPPKSLHTKRKAPNPPSQTKTTKSSTFTSIIGGWRALKQKAHFPKSTTQKGSPKTNINASPTPSKDVQTRDMFIPSINPVVLRKAPPVPPSKMTINDRTENKTIESILEIQKIAAMVTPKLINRYPDDYMEERRKSEENTTNRLSRDPTDNPIDLIDVEDSTSLPEEGDIYEDITVKVVENIDNNQKELVSISQDFSTMFQEVLKEVRKEDDSEVMPRGGISRASSRRRNSALNALDKVIFSFLTEDEETCGQSDQVEGEEIESVEISVSDNNVNETQDVKIIGEANLNVGSSQNCIENSEINTPETENQSIYEDILQDILQNSNNEKTLQSKQMPKASPRTFLKENKSNNKDGTIRPPPKVPPRPTPRPILRTDNTTAAEQDLKAYLEEFYEDVAPVTEPVNTLSTVNCGTSTVTLETVGLGSTSTITETPVGDIDITRSNCEETDFVDSQLISEVTSKEIEQLTLEKDSKLSECVQDDSKMDVVLSEDETDFVAAPSNDSMGISGDVTVTSNGDIDLDTASLEEKSADLVASLTDGTDRKHSMLTWDVDTCVTLATVDQQLKLLLLKVGVTDEELKDRATRDFILQFINEHGGKDQVKKEVMFLTTLTARRNRRPKKKLTELVNISIDGDTNADDESTYM